MVIVPILPEEPNSNVRDGELVTVISLLTTVKTTHTHTDTGKTVVVTVLFSGLSDNLDDGSDSDC